VKPRLRGWFHAYAALISVASGATLIALASSLRGGTASATTSIYCATITMLFGTSALYHRLNWKPTALGILKRVDHSMIFVFIAGTYTPIAALTLPRHTAEAVLIVVWSGAAVGVALQTTWRAAPRWLSAPSYNALGWVAVFVLPDLLHRAGVAAFVLLLVGGAVYTLGAVVYALKRPDPWPGTFGFHEVFHLCTLVAALCHYIAVWFVVFG
jgi:hemolysin III